MSLLRMRLRGVVSASLVACLAASCATIHEVGRTPHAGSGGAVRVRVFADDDARAAGTVLGASLVGELERREGREWTPVFRSLEPTWTVAGLAPDRYRVSFGGRLDAAGEVEGLERPITETVDVREGEVAEVEAVLDHVSPAMIAAGAVGIVVAAVLLHEWLDDLDLPAPPPPPPSWVAETVFWVTLAATESGEGPGEWEPRPAGPVVTSHFPEQGARVAARRVRLVFSLSAPLDPETLAPDSVELSTSDGELLPGRTRYDARRWWIVWEPEGDLPPAAKFVARLHPAGIAGEDGLPLAGPVEFTFTTP